MTSLPLLGSTNSSFACSFNKTTNKPSSSSQQHLIRRASITCKARDESQRDYKLDRRDVLIGLGGIYGVAAGLGLDRKAEANPIQAADITKCLPADLPSGGTIDCCPPATKTIIDFVLPPKSEPLRVRRAAHLLDADYVAKYTRAVQLMRSLPDDDPRSFKQQSFVHCAYCNGSFDQIGFPGEEIQVHGSWTFLPWHRFYLYFHERILGKLIGDPSFSLPFWNWDAPAGYKLPAVYTDPKSPLYNKLRDAKHQPPAKVDLDFNGTDRTFTDAELIKHNNATMYRQIVSGAKNAELFLGSPYRAGDSPSSTTPGTLENAPHGPVHVWTGDRTQPNVEDMGTLYSAARDPIFYAHHSNVDRMWDIWKSLGGNRKDFTDPDFLNASFLFYNENKQLVRVKIKDSLDSFKLRNAYQSVDIPWLGTRPAPKAKEKKESLKSIQAAKDKPKFPLTLDKPVTLTVKRPKLKRGQDEKEDEEEVLVVQGIEFDKDLYIKIDLYVNATDELGPASSEFAGTFTNVPRKHKPSKGEKKTLKTNAKFALTDLLEDLDAEDDDSVVVTFVPCAGKGKVSIAGVKIEFSK